MKLQSINFTDYLQDCLIYQSFKSTLMHYLVLFNVRQTKSSSHKFKVQEMHLVLELTKENVLIFALTLQ